MKHYLHSGEYGPFLRQLIFLYTIFTAAVLFAGGSIFFLKTKFDPRLVFEYYRGSEATILIFPEFQDHYVNAKTFEGMMHLAIPHFLGYSLLIFVTTHLIRTLEVKGKLNIIQFRVLFTLAFLDISSGFVMLLAPFAFVYARLIIFFAFFIALSYYNFILALAMINNHE